MVSPDNPKWSGPGPDGRDPQTIGDSVEAFLDQPGNRKNLEEGSVRAVEEDVLVALAIQEFAYKPLDESSSANIKAVQGRDNAITAANQQLITANDRLRQLRWHQSNSRP